VSVATETRTPSGAPRETTALTFNVIYLPETVRYLSLFVFSLLEWSGCRFRLVANGCSDEERELLRRLCEQDDRLEFLALPMTEVVPHYRALEFLRDRERSDHFCFMDADIMAVGEFEHEILSRLERCAGVFSGLPIWCTEAETLLPPRARRVVGRYHRTDQGLCLGTTYVAAYDNRKLGDLMSASGIGLRDYPWETIPEEHRRRLVEMGMRRDKFDTAKVANLLLQARGERLEFVDCDGLLHIGGYDARTLAERGEGLLRARSLRHLVRRVRGLSAPRNRKRVHTCRHFVRVLEAVFRGETVPEPPSLGDSRIERRVRDFTDGIVALHERHAWRIR